MLTCSRGHDNFPLTSVYNYGYDSSARIVEFCHQCGERITEKCEVCDRLHPIGTSVCSVYSLSIEAFKENMAGLETRVRVFKELPEVRDLVAKYSLHMSKIKAVALMGGAALLVSSFSLLNIFSKTLGASLCLFGMLSLLSSLVFSIGILTRIINRVTRLWDNKNSGVLAPCSIYIYSNQIKLDFDERNDWYYVSYRSRLRDFLLKQTH